MRPVLLQSSGQDRALAWLAGRVAASRSWHRAVEFFTVVGPPRPLGQLQPCARSLVSELLIVPVMAPTYHSRGARRDTQHTVGLVSPHVARGAAVLDVGCGEGYVAAELARREADVTTIDIVDIRRVECGPFQRFDGDYLPFRDHQFDLVMLNFVLHHVPDDRKIGLLREAARVSRDKVFILEDTPRNLLDRLLNRRHGERFRARIGSCAPFGFLTRREWEWLFRGLGLPLRESRTVGRFSRAPWQPFARSAFLLQVAPVL
jgi:SAM-dependent methyltransferase